MSSYLEFDRDNGFLLSIFNKELGFDAIEYKQADSLFRITYPVSGQLGSAAHPNREKEGKKWAVKAK